MVVKMPRDSLPSQADPGLLHLNDPRCGAPNVNDKIVEMKVPLEGCGTVRRFRCHFSLSTLNNHILGSFPYDCQQSIEAIILISGDKNVCIYPIALSDRAIVCKHMGNCLNKLKNIRQNRENKPSPLPQITFEKSSPIISPPAYKPMG